MRKPKVNEEGLQNELRHSQFFRRDADEAPSQVQDEFRGGEQPRRADPGEAFLLDRPTERSVSRRTSVRRAFEFYADQLETLERFALEERFRGEEGNKSQMVRQAVDTYISKRVKAGR
jgi:hypothetical protein